MKKSRFTEDQIVFALKQAVQLSQQIRNLIMVLVRTRSTPLGRAMAQQMKSLGKRSMN